MVARRPVVCLRSLARKRSYRFAYALTHGGASNGREHIGTSSAAMLQANIRVKGTP